jgi:hypothetical protein
MPTLTEALFRAGLTEAGIYAGDATLDAAASFMVFSQASDAMIDAAAWERQAATFFAMRIGLAVPKTYGDTPPTSDAALVVIAGREGQGALRLIYGRPAAPRDLIRAREAERRGAVGGGLADLAARCPMVWLVEASGEDDASALAIAAIVALAHLGPIVPPSGAELYGVRTARMKLAGALIK